MTKILMVLPRYLPIIGGAEVQCSRLVQEITRKRSSEVEIVGIVTRRVFSELLGNENIDGVNVRRLPPKGLGIISEYLFCLLLFFYLVLNYRKYDVLHCHASSIFGITCSLAGALLKKKVLVKISTNGEFNSMQKTYIRRKLCNFASKFCTYVALNEQGFNEIESNVFGARKVIIPNGIDFNIEHSANLVEAKAIRQRIHDDFGLDAYVCIFVGRLVQRKGINDLLKAVGLLRAIKNIVVLVVGNSAHQRDFEKLAVEECGNLVLVGQVNNIFPYLLAADVFVSPSYAEGLPNTVVEALSCGRTCILSDIPPHQELYAEHQNSIKLFSTGNITELSSKIQESLSIRLTHVELLPAECFNALAGRFAITEVANKYIDVYRGEQ